MIFVHSGLTYHGLRGWVLFSRKSIFFSRLFFAWRHSVRQKLSNCAQKVNYVQYKPKISFKSSLQFFSKIIFSLHPLKVLQLNHNVSLLFLIFSALMLKIYKLYFIIKCPFSRSGWRSLCDNLIRIFQVEVIALLWVVNLKSESSQTWDRVGAPT